MDETLPAVSKADGNVPPPPNAKPLSDMRSQLTQLPVETQNHVLAEYRDRRKNFRDWLLAQLKEGVHFGFPPGLMPKTREVNGVTFFEQKTRSGSTWVSEVQWRPRPSLYKAGADFVIELMAVRDSYEPDLDMWKMMGGKPNEICMRCDLFDRVSGEKIADGHGYGSRGDKPDWEGKQGNSAIKMASKRAKVAAVLNAFGLADLFTQDLEDLSADAPETEIQNPKQASNAPPVVPPREDAEVSPGPKGIGAVTSEELAKLFARWKKIALAEAEQFGESCDVDKKAFIAFLATKFAKDEKTVVDLSSWTRAEVRQLENDFRDNEASLGL